MINVAVDFDTLTNHLVAVHQEHTVLMATVEKLCSEVNTITENSTTLLNMQERLSQKFQLQNMFAIQLNTFSEQLHLRIGTEFKEHLKTRAKIDNLQLLYGLSFVSNESNIRIGYKIMLNYVKCAVIIQSVCRKFLYLNYRLSAKLSGNSKWVVERVLIVAIGQSPNIWLISRALMYCMGKKYDFLLEKTLRKLYNIISNNDYQEDITSGFRQCIITVSSYYYCSTVLFQDLLCDILLAAFNQKINGTRRIQVVLQTTLQEASACKYLFNILQTYSDNVDLLIKVLKLLVLLSFSNVSVGKEITCNSSWCSLFYNVLLNNSTNRHIALNCLKLVTNLSVSFDSQCLFVSPGVHSCLTTIITENFRYSEVVSAYCDTCLALMHKNKENQLLFASTSACDLYRMLLENSINSIGLGSKIIKLLNSICANKTAVCLLLDNQICESIMKLIVDNCNIRLLKDSLLLIPILFHDNWNKYSSVANCSRSILISMREDCLNLEIIRLLNACIVKLNQLEKNSNNCSQSKLLLKNDCCTLHINHMEVITKHLEGLKDSYGALQQGKMYIFDELFQFISVVFSIGICDINSSEIAGSGSGTQTSVMDITNCDCDIRMLIDYICSIMEPIGESWRLHALELAELIDLISKLLFPLWVCVIVFL